MDVYRHTARMDPDTFGGGDQDPGDPATYWRRRVFALGGVLGVVALLAWACSGASGKEETQQAAQKNAKPSTSASPMATVTVTVTPSGTPSASPSGSVSPSGSPSATGPSEFASPSPSASASPEKLGPDDPCDPDDVVVSSDLGHQTYKGGEQPQFRVTVVNTGKRTCAYDVGPKALEMRVTSGSDRVWSSGDCASVSDARHLKRGVPYSRTITWDRTRSNSKCHHSDQKAQPGTYVVRLRGDHVKTESHVFYLR